jgi:hypothetical protein
MIIEFLFHLLTITMMYITHPIDIYTFFIIYIVTYYSMIIGLVITNRLLHQISYLLEKYSTNTYNTTNSINFWLLFNDSMVLIVRWIKFIIKLNITLMIMYFICMKKLVKLIFEPFYYLCGY